MAFDTSSITSLTFSGEPRFVDADAADNRTSTDPSSSHLTTRRRDFRTNLIERDKRCVLTDEISVLCDACHIIPHSKGSQVRPSEFSVVAFSLNQVHCEPRPLSRWNR